MHVISYGTSDGAKFFGYIIKKATGVDQYFAKGREWVDKKEDARLFTSLMDADKFVQSENFRK